MKTKIITMTAAAISLFTCLILCSNLVFAVDPTRNGHYEEEAAIVRKCLTDEAGNIAKSDLEKVKRFSKWNQSEEIPCFTHCLSHHKGWFDVSAGRWIRHKLNADLGDKMYMYCENELQGSFESVCDFVFKGFQCLRDAANNIATTYKTMLICANALHISDVAELQKYGTLPHDEHIPCLFKCLAEKLNFYDINFEWNFDNWIKAFGPLKSTEDSVNYSICRASEEERSEERQKCAWMYREYLCFEQLSKDENKIETTTSTITTSIEMLPSEVSPSEVSPSEVSQSESSTSEVAPLEVSAGDT